jgi:hypothetical protein
MPGKITVDASPLRAENPRNRFVTYSAMTIIGPGSTKEFDHDYLQLHKIFSVDTFKSNYLCSGVISKLRSDICSVIYPIH